MGKLKNLNNKTINIKKYSSVFLEKYLKIKLMGKVRDEQMKKIFFRRKSKK